MHKSTKIIDQILNTFEVMHIQSMCIIIQFATLNSSITNQ